MVEAAKNYESQYTEGREIGQGAFGTVYEVTHKQEERKYVAKKMGFDLQPSDLDKCL